MSRLSAGVRPDLIRTLNERVLIGHIRRSGPCSRADLARISGLSKPTVSQAVVSIERAGLIRSVGKRKGAPGRAAVLFEIRPDAGFALGLEVGRHYIRGALADLSGKILAEGSNNFRGGPGAHRTAELAAFAARLCARQHMRLSDVTQAVIGCTDAWRRVDRASANQCDWTSPAVLADLHAALGASLRLESHIDTATLAELTLGHGRESDSFVLVSVSAETGIDVGLVIGRQLHRGVHGQAGRIGFLPVADKHDHPPEGSSCWMAVGSPGPGAEKVTLVADVLCSVISVVDPGLIVLGGPTGRAPGFADAVGGELHRLAPVVPEIRVSMLGREAPIAGCVAAAVEAAWEQLIAQAGSAPHPRRPVQAGTANAVGAG